jgi:hypothetical protein
LAFLAISVNSRTFQGRVVCFHRAGSFFNHYIAGFGVLSASESLNRQQWASPAPPKNQELLALVAEAEQRGSKPKTIVSDFKKN